MKNMKLSKNRITIGRNHISVVSLFFALVYLSFVLGCSYYKVNTIPPQEQTISEQVQKENKYIIIKGRVNNINIVKLVRNLKSNTSIRTGHYIKKQSDFNIRLYIFIVNIP